MDNLLETVNMTEPAAARDTRSEWLPESYMRKRINLNEAIKNYCNAAGGNMYFQYCRTHARTEEVVGDRRIIKWANQDAAIDFDRPIKDYLRYLYQKYWRLLPMSQGYPKEAPLNLGLFPPSVDNFRVMLAREEKLKSKQ